MLAGKTLNALACRPGEHCGNTLLLVPIGMRRRGKNQGSKETKQVRTSESQPAVCKQTNNRARPCLPPDENSLRLMRTRSGSQDAVAKVSHKQSERTQTLGKPIASIRMEVRENALETTIPSKETYIRNCRRSTSAATAIVIAPPGNCRHQLLRRAKQRGPNY